MNAGTFLGDLFGTLLIWVGGWSLLDGLVNYGLKRFDVDTEVNRLVIYGLIMIVGVMILLYFLRREQTTQ